MLRFFKSAAFVITLVLTAVTYQIGHSEDYRYSVSFSGGMANLASGIQGPFTLQNSYGFGLGYHPTPRWSISLNYARIELANDTSAVSSFSLSHNKDFDTLNFNSSRLALLANRKFFDLKQWLSLSAGLGGGLLIWEYVDPSDGMVLKRPGEKNQTLDYRATEIFVSAASELELAASHRISLFWNAEVDYLTGAGVEFSPEVESVRDRRIFSTFVGLRLHFGAPPPAWRSEKVWTNDASRSASLSAEVDSDGDLVPDVRDECPNSRPGSTVDARGCPVDSDGDGVLDGFDDCPSSDRRAIGMVDIHGCAVDSDFDGIPDYLDQCPQNSVGAVVDAGGCPLDSDADGVPDGLDDCPNTLVGVDVDRFGCINLGMLAEPMVLNIDYVSGSFEVDHATKEKLERLSRLLNFVEDVKLEISGYTDNIGMPTANRDLSLKRARRVRDFLIRQGVSTDRMEVFGRGEENFVASNDTAEGRAKNRRVEIVFLR